MKEAVVVNLAKGGWYPRGQARLIDSVNKFGNGLFDIVTFSDESQIGSPTHQDNPYAFKVYAIEHCKNMGYKIVFWIDSSIFPVKDMTPAFQYINDTGHLMESCGYNAGQYTNDNALNYFGINRERAKEIKLFSAGFQALNFDSLVTNEYFRLWKQSMLAGAFCGSWSDHRHDMSCGSIIADRLNMQHSPGGHFMAYIGGSYSTPKETVIFHAIPC